jgi:hypothetical protein
MGSYVIRDTKTGKIIRTIKTGSRSKSSGSSSSTSSKQLYATATKIGDKSGTKYYLVDGKLTTKKPSSSGGGSRSSSQVASSKGQTGVIDITDTSTGIRKISKVDLTTGKTISSRKSQAPKIQLATIQQFNQKQQAKQKSVRNQLSNIPLTQTRDKQIANKVLTGQTITPGEKARYNQIINENNERLTKQQITLLKNAPKDIAKGLFEVAKEVVVLSKDAVIGAYNYGYNASERAYANNESVLNVFGRDIKKVVKGTNAAAKFVIENPGKAAAIVGAAASQSGKSYKSAFLNNPVKTLTKTAVYLFPGTVLKGVGAVGKVGVKGVTSLTRAKRLVSLNKVTNAARQGSLSVAQAKKLDKAIAGASKIGNAAKRETKIKTVLRGILKDRGVKAKRGASIKELANQVKTAEITVKKITPKPKPSKVKFIDLKTGKTKYITPKKALEKVKRTRDTTKYFDADTGKKITKKEFLKKTKEGKVKTINLKTGKVTYKKPRAKRVDAGKPKTKFIEIKGKKAKKITKKQFEATKKASKKPQKKKVSPKKTKVINLNKVNIEKVKVSQVRPSMFKSKKAQVRFSRQVQTQVQKEVRTVTKAKKTVKALKKKKVSPKKVNTAKRELARVKKKLNKLLQIVKNNKSIIIRAPIIIKSINDAIKNINAIDKAILKTPKKVQPQKPKKATPQKKAPAKTPKKVQPQKPKKATPQKKTPATKSKPKTSQVSKQVPKQVKKPKKPKKPTKKPKKKKIKFKIKFGATKKKATKKGAIVYTPTGKNKPVTIKTGLPINRAKKVAKQGLDNSILGSVGVKAYGKTTAKDIKDTTSKKNRRKRSKKTRVQNIVEKSKYRLDTPGEKKGISFSKAVKSAIKKEKAKLKTTPNKAKKTTKKANRSKVSKPIKKASKITPKKVVKAAVKKKATKTIKKAIKKKATKKMSAATKKKISKALKKAYAKKVKKSIKKKSKKR